MTKQSKVWFITGCSKGFGRVFAQKLASLGHQVFATARDTDTIRALESEYPGLIKVGKVDITKREQIDRGVVDALASFGRIDVLVNNAGFGVVGPIEGVSDQLTHEIFETNFFGTLNMTRAVLPHMRARRSGHVFQMSSSHAWGGGPGIGMYSASKCALEGASESMALELAPLGVRLTILQPGPYKSDFLGVGLKRSSNDIEDYFAVNSAVYDAVSASHNKQPGDPLGIVKAMLEVVEAAHPPLRLLCGKIAIDRARRKLESSTTEVAAWQELGIAADFAT